MEAMTAEQAAEAGKDLDFAKVWAALMKTDAQIEKMRERMAESSAKTDAQIEKMREGMAESSAKTDAQIAKMSAETDAQIAKIWAETAKTIKELSANIGGVNNTLGKLTEEMVAAKVLELFQDLGYEVGKASRNIKYYKGRKRLAEIDVFLENGDLSVAVEVKTSLSVQDVNGHVECMARLRGYMDEHGDKRKLIGAVAGGVVPDNVLEYARQQGFYVLVQSGESICVAETAPGFQPKQW